MTGKFDTDAGKFDVGGRFDRDGPRRRPSEPPTLTALTEIPGGQGGGGWDPRRAATLDVPEPMMPRKFWTNEPDLQGFRHGVQIATETAKDIAKLNHALAEKEQSQQELERVLEGRRLMPAVIEMDRLETFGKLQMAQAGLRSIRRRIEQKEQEEEQELLNNERRNHLEGLEYEKALALKTQELAEAKARAAQAERIAKARAAAEQAEAERDQHERQAEAEQARRKMVRRRHRRADAERVEEVETDRAEAETEAESMTPEYMAARRHVQHRRRIDRDAAAEEQEILARAGGDESRLPDEERERLEDIRKARATAHELYSKNVANIIFPGDEEDEE